MAYANVIELETAVAECIAYCDTNPDADFVQTFGPRLRHAAAKFEESVAESDRHFVTWQNGLRTDKLAWKKLGKELRAAQATLARQGAVGYPDERVLHWDPEILTDAVGNMVAYLKERGKAVEGGSDHAERLESLLSSARGEKKDAGSALAEYSRLVLFRAGAMATLASTIGDFRTAMRRTLGKRHPEYAAIRWPMSVAPDVPVL